MPDVVQRNDPSERRAIGQALDRRGHDRIVVAENSQLPGTPLTVRIWRAKRNQRSHRTPGSAGRVASGNGATEAVSDQMDAVAAGFFICDASELRGGISQRLPSRVPENKNIAETHKPMGPAKPEQIASPAT